MNAQYWNTKVHTSFTRQHGYITNKLQRHI